MDKHKYLSELFEIMQNKLSKENFCNWLAFCYGVLSIGASDLQIKTIKEQLKMFEEE